MLEWLKNPIAWRRKRRRQKLLAGPVPAGWEEAIQRVAYFRCLDVEKQARVRDGVRIFLAEKIWQGCDGLELTEPMRVTIATMACVMVAGMDGYFFENVQEILVYPTDIKADRKELLSGDAYLEGTTELLGETYRRGPVRLAWDRVQGELIDPESGTNVVIHEFAHRLDGDSTGVPDNLPAELRERWQQIMSREFNRFCKRLDRGRDTLIEEGGAENHTEFFAYVSETFFGLPIDLENEHPELYALFRDYYRQDPGAVAVAGVMSFAAFDGFSPGGMPTALRGHANRGSSP